ncbi:MAG: hypothetical protein LBR67_05720 [Dysgonamonadaceae bacterium]|jgi:hypothetical protein|nr:hypothetical protein [Dysgonamonadaceae bacterium]
MKKFLYILIALGALTMVGLTACDDENDVEVSVVTTNLQDISYNSVTVNGEVTGSGTRGVCYATNSNPTVNDGRVDAEAQSSRFSVVINNLQKGTTYWFRVFLIQGAEVIYGEAKDCTTYDEGTPAIAVTSTGKPTMTSVTCYVRVVIDGGKTITERGICWSASPNPTSNLPTSKSEGSGSGAFTSVITGLSPETTYYVRPYVISDGQVIYGPESTVRTANVIDNIKVTDTDPGATSAEVSILTSYKPENVTATEQGVVFGSANNVTLANGTKIAASSIAPGSYSFTITPLGIKSTSYVRAYIVTTDYGTYYSDPVPVTTTVTYEWYLGNYTLLYSSSTGTTTPNRTLPITLTRGTAANTYVVTGILTAENEATADLIWKYDPETSDLTMAGQIMGTTLVSGTSYDHRWLVYGKNAAGSWYTTTGTYIMRSTNFHDVNGKTNFDFVDQGTLGYTNWTGYTQIGFVTRAYNGTTNMGNVVGAGGYYAYYYMSIQKE